MIAGYKSWWGRKTITWFPPPRETYSSAGVDVAINPELGLEIDGQRYVIKLYLKADEVLEKTRADLIVTLMNHVLSPAQPEGTQFSVLDVRKSKQFTYSLTRRDFQAMVDAELAYIATLWPHV